jgi:hypothetical protein
VQKHEIERVLDLQQRAYNLLLWISEQARHQPDLLNESNIEKLRYAQDCDEWVRHMMGIFPEKLRPSEADISAFAHLLSSFFNTSFHVETVNESNWSGRYSSYETWVTTKLVPGAPKSDKGPAAKKRAKEKDRQSAHNLQLIVLEELAFENDIDLTRAQIETIAADSAIAEPLNLWSYAHELMRRSQFASQGAAVHQMWLSLDRKTRESLHADTIWQAREQLCQALAKAAAG